MHVLRHEFLHDCRSVLFDFGFRKTNMNEKQNVLFQMLLSYKNNYIYKKNKTMKKNVVKMVVKYSRIAAVAIIFLASVSCNNKNSKSKPNVLEVEDTDSAIVVKGAYNVSKILTWNNSLVLITQQEPLFRVFSLDSCRQVKTLLSVIKGKPLMNFCQYHTV